VSPNFSLSAAANEPVGRFVTASPHLDEETNLQSGERINRDLPARVTRPVVNRCDHHKHDDGDEGSEKRDRCDQADDRTPARVSTGNLMFNDLTTPRRAKDRKRKQRHTSCDSALTRRFRS
jgi:hypothetical protein